MRGPLTEDDLAEGLLVRALARMVQLEADLAELAEGAEPAPTGLVPVAAELEDLGWVLALLTALAQPAGPARQSALAEVRHHPNGLAILRRLALGPQDSRKEPASGPMGCPESPAGAAAAWAAAAEELMEAGAGLYEKWQSERIPRHLNEGSERGSLDLERDAPQN